MASAAARRPRAVAAGATRLTDAVLRGPGAAVAAVGRRRRPCEAVLLPPNSGDREVCKLCTGPYPSGSMQVIRNALFLASPYKSGPPRKRRFLFLLAIVYNLTKVFSLGGCEKKTAMVPKVQHS